MARLELRLAQHGMGMSDAEVVELHKTAGDRVEAGAAPGMTPGEALEAEMLRHADGGRHAAALEAAGWKLRFVLDRQP